MNCPLCGNNCNEKCYTNSAIQVDRDVLFCESCALFFVHPMPTDKELKELYEKEWSWDYGMQERRSFIKNIFHTVYEMHQKFIAQDRAKHLFSLVPDRKSKIIEIGSGNGAFLKTIASRYGTVEGIEPSLKNDVRQGGVTILRKAINAGLSLEPIYDAVCMYMVLEHLTNPVEIIQALCDALKPEGCLIIEVPYSPHKEYEKLDDFELNKVFNNVHVFHHSRNSVSRMAALTGTFLAQFEVFRKQESIEGFNVFSLYPNASREKGFYKMLAAVNLLILYAKGLAGASIHETIDERVTPFADGYWIRFVLKRPSHRSSPVSLE